MASDAASNSCITTPKRDEQLWFEDGNIVIVARNTVAFRVHKSLLTRASPVFQDLFAIGNPNMPGTEMMEGCPVTHVPDNPQDLCAFLKLIFVMTPQALADRIPISYRTLAGIIRCAHKYQADTTLEHARTRLLQIFRSEPFCASRLDSTHPVSEEQHWREFKDNPVVSDMQLTNAFETVSLLRLMDPGAKDTRSLSLALYMCMLCDPCVLRNRISHPDTDEVFRLSDHDYTLCITAMQKLSHELRRVH